MGVCHVTIGAVGSGKQNGVLVVADALLREQHKLTDAYCICIVKTEKVSTCQNVGFHRLGLGLFREIYSRNRSSKTVFHLHGALNVQLHVLALFMVIIGARYCVSPHGAFANRSKINSTVKVAYIRTIVAWFLRRSQFVHLYGDADASLIDRYRIMVQRYVAPNGAPTIPKKSIRSSVCDDDAILRLGYCGRINYEQKGLELIPKILTGLANDGYHFSFDLIGSGPDRHRFENEVCARGLEEYVNFHGALYDERKFEALQRIDIFLHPSRYEGMPLAPVEALAAGAKILVSPETNLLHYLEGIDGVFQIESRKPEVWVEAVIRANSTVVDPNQVENLIRGKLSWPRIAAGFIDRYWNATGG